MHLLFKMINPSNTLSCVFRMYTPCSIPGRHENVMLTQLHQQLTLFSSFALSTVTATSLPSVASLFTSLLKNCFLSTKTFPPPEIQKFHFDELSVQTIDSAPNYITQTGQHQSDCLLSKLKIPKTQLLTHTLTLRLIVIHKETFVMQLVARQKLPRLVA